MYERKSHIKKKEEQKKRFFFSIKYILNWWGLQIEFRTRKKNSINCPKTRFNFVFRVSIDYSLRFRGDLFNRTTYKLNNTVIETRQFSTKKNFLCSFSAIFCALWSERWINNQSLIYIDIRQTNSHSFDCHKSCSPKCQNSRTARWCMCVRVCEWVLVPICANTFGPTEFLCFSNSTSQSPLIPKQTQNAYYFNLCQQLLLVFGCVECNFHVLFDAKLTSSRFFHCLSWEMMNFKFLIPNIPFDL